MEEWQSEADREAYFDDLMRYGEAMRQTSDGKSSHVPRWKYRPDDRGTDEP